MVTMGLGRKSEQMASIEIPGVASIDDIVNAFKSKGPWLNRFDSIIAAMVNAKDIPVEDSKKEVLALLTTALKRHLAKEKLVGKPQDSQ